MTLRPIVNLFPTLQFSPHLRSSFSDPIYITIYGPHSPISGPYGGFQWIIMGAFDRLMGASGFITFFMWRLHSDSEAGEGATDFRKKTQCVKPCGCSSNFYTLYA